MGFTELDPDLISFEFGFLLTISPNSYERKMESLRLTACFVLNLLTYFLTYLLTYSLTHSLRGADFFLSS